MEKIYLSSPHMGGEEMKYINQAFSSNWIAPLGENVDSFEKEICDYLNAKNAVALSSGTAAIHLALKALGVGKGDIVFAPSLTFVATCNPILYCGAVPVFLDCDYATWNISAEVLEKAYKKYPNPKALVVVDLYGNPADYDQIKSIAARHNTPIVEDAAEALGSSYKGIKAGNFGELGILSFNGNKIITTSGGGMLLSDNEEYIQKAKFWATQAREPARHYEHKEIGYNYRLSNICAAIGRGQLKVLDLRVKQKTFINNYYKKELTSIEEISFMPVTEGAVSNNWLTCILIDPKSKVKPLDIITALEKENIESRPIWKPMSMQPLYKGYEYITFDNVCEDIYSRGLCLPSDTKMTEKELDLVVKVIKDVFYE
ncbi:MAG TPA: aminotransferase class I/II-fold pyridoxal phosphate-dependent enzyme [Clostridia bacterium]